LEGLSVGLLQTATVAGRGAGKLRELAVEGTIEEESLPECKGDREDELAVVWE